MDHTELSLDFTPQYNSYYLSTDGPSYDDGSSVSSNRDQNQKRRPNDNRTSNDDLTENILKVPPTRKISRSKSVDNRARCHKASVRRSVKMRRASSLKPGDPTLAPTLDFMSQKYKRHSICPSQCPDSRRRSTVARIPVERLRKERRRRRIVLIIMVSFLLLVLASVLVVVITLTHSSEMQLHNVTSKYYTFAVPPHHPLIRQENERMIESFNVPSNMSRIMMEHRKHLEGA